MRQPINSREIVEGEQIDVMIPEFVREKTNTEKTKLEGAEITRIHWGRHLKNDEGEYEYDDDIANQFSFQCGDWKGSVYCDRAMWKLSIGDNPSGEYVPDCNTVGIYYHEP